MENFASEKSPACLTAGGASILSESQESLNLPDKNEFVSQSGAPGAGLEPATWGLTGPRATIAPPRNGILYILRIS